MTKKIIAIFLIIFSVLLLGCKKENQSSKPETIETEETEELLDLSVYELECISDNKEDSMNLTSQMSIENFFYRPNDYINRVIFEFDVEKIFYGKFNEKKYWSEFFDDSKPGVLIIDGREVSYDEFNFNKEIAYLNSIYAFPWADGKPKYDYECGVIDSLETITLDEYNNLDSSLKTEYEKYILLQNPVNIITKKEYDFKILSPYDDIFENIYYKDNNYEIKKVISILYKNLFYEFSLYSKTCYYELMIKENQGLPTNYLVVNENDEEGILLKGTENGYMDNELIYTYNYLTTSTIVSPTMQFSIGSILKEKVIDSKYKQIRYTKHSFYNEDIMKEMFFKFFPLKDLLKIIIHYKDIKNKYDIIENDEIINKIAEVGMYRLLRYNVYESMDSFHTTIRKTANDSSTALYEISFDKEDSYYLVIAPKQENSSRDFHYIRFKKTDDIDLNFIERIIYVVRGKIIKNLSNGTSCDIDCIFPIDITYFNDIAYEYCGLHGDISDRVNYIKEINYAFDGLIIGLDKSDELNVDGPIVIGYDVNPKCVFDINNNNGKLEVVIKQKYNNVEDIPKSTILCETISVETRKSYSQAVRTGVYTHKGDLVIQYTYYVAFMFDVSMSNEKLILKLK